MVAAETREMALATRPQMDLGVGAHERARPGRERLPQALVGILAVQWAILCGWTWWVYDSWNVHVDFATRSQAAYGILHGNWNPLYTIVGWTHLADHFDLSTYPLAFLTLLWPHLVWLFIAQVTLLVFAEYGALKVIDVFVRRSWWPADFRRRTALSVAVLLFVLNPISVWAVAQDVHLHMYGAVCGLVFVLLFFLRRQWPRMAGAVVFTLLFGDLSAQLLVMLGLSLLLVSLRSRRERLVAGAVVAAGAIWWAVTNFVGGGAGSELGLHYGYLAATSRQQIGIGEIVSGLVRHPGLGLDRLPSAFASMWGALSIGGVVGLFTPLSLPIALNALETGLGVQSWVGWPYLSPGAMAEQPWQMMPMLVLEPLLTIVALGWLRRNGSRLGRAMARATPVLLGILVANALLWSLIWLPQVIASTNLTPPATVAVLNQVQRRIPAADEVVASIGVIGRLGYRPYLYATVFGSADTVIPLRTATVDFVITPVTGQESNAVDLADLTSDLLRQRNARVLIRRDDVWLIEYHRLPGQRRLVVHYGSDDVVGAALPTPPQAVTQVNWPAPDCLWSDARTGGYLFTKYRDALAPGQYVLQMSVEGKTGMTVSVGDDDTHQVLARGNVVRRQRLHRVALPFTVIDAGRIPVSFGWGPYRLSFPIPQENDIIETRLWAGGRGPRAVCSVSIRRVL